VDISRIQREFVQAQSIFAHVELQPTVDGKVFVRTALQTVNQATYVLSIRFPENYPYEMPRVTVDAPAIAFAPHRYQGGILCYLHPSMWNPGVHHLSFVIARSAKWLNKFEIWKSTGKWPGAEMKH
jgi:ubiquitin-protein ligase